MMPHRMARCARERVRTILLFINTSDMLPLNIGFLLARISATKQTLPLNNSLFSQMFSIRFFERDAFLKKFMLTEDRRNPNYD